MKTAVNKTGSCVFYHTFPLGHNPTNRSNAFSARIQRRASPALLKPLLAPLCRIPDTPEKPLKYKK